MKSHHLRYTLLLCFLPSLVQALPQVSEGSAYPQEIYYTRDFHFYAPQTLYDLVQQLPGITIGWQADGQAEVQLHGLDGRYLTILINGQPLLGAGSNNILTTRQIPAIMVDHIEIDRNSRADLSQGGGSAGTINVVLADAYSGNGLLISAGGQPLNNRVALAGHLTDDENSLRMLAERRLQHYDSEGKTTTDSSSDHWQSSRRELNRNLHLSYDSLINDRHPLQLYALYLQGDNEETLDGSYPLNRPSTLRAADLRDVSSDKQQAQSSQRMGGNLRLHGSHLTLDTFFLAEQFELNSALTQTQPVSARQKNLIDDSRYYLGWQLSETRNEHRWRLGISMQQKKRNSSSAGDAILTSNSDRSGLPYNYDVKKNELSVFLLDRWHLTEATEFEAGMRMDNSESSLDSFSGDTHSGIDTSTYWLPSFHLLHRLDNQRRLRLSMSQSVREPEIADQVPYEFRQDTTLWRGNEDLEAELISNMDISYEQNFLRPSSALTDRDSGFYLRAFQRIINHAIYQRISTENTDDMTALTVLTPENSEGNGILRGLETDLEFYPGSQDIRIDLGAGYYHSEMQSTEDIPDRYQLPNQPRYMARLGFQHQPSPGLRYGAHWRFQGNSKQFLPGDSGYIVQSTSSMQNLDVYLEYQWNASWFTLATVHLNPGDIPWQQQSGIRQYRDVQPVWQLALMGLY